MFAKRYYSLFSIITVLACACSNEVAYTEEGNTINDKKVNYASDTFTAEVIDSVSINKLFFTKPYQSFGKSFQYYSTLQEHREYKNERVNIGVLLVGYQDEEELPLGLDLWVANSQYSTVSPNICSKIYVRSDVPVDENTIALSDGVHEEIIFLLTDSPCENLEDIHFSQNTNRTLQVSLDNNRDVKVNRELVGKVYYSFEKE